MALTKSVAAVDEWAAVAKNTVRKGATVDVSGCYEAILHIFCALTEAVAHTGSDIIVQISSNTTGDEDWTTLAVFGSPTGTAFKVDIAADEAAGQTVISVTNPTTVNLDHPGKYLFIENTANVANSEVVFQVSNEGDTVDTITILDGLTNAQAAADGDIWEIDSATIEVVGHYVVAIPRAANRVRVIYDNTADPDGARIHTNCRISKVTAL